MSEHEISQEILIAEYEAVYYYVLSLCHNSSEAEDITQETFSLRTFGELPFRDIADLPEFVYDWKEVQD